MRFWDASAIVPLLITEGTSRRLQSLVISDPRMAVWWASEVECVSALVRREREGMLDTRALEMALHQLREFADAWLEVEQAALSGKARCEYCAYTHCVPQMLCSWLQRLLPPSGVRHLWKWSRSTSV